MNRSDLAEILASARVDPTYFHMDGLVDEGLCIVPHGQTWQVFLYERGCRFEERVFDSEDAAAVYFLKRVLTLWRPE